jgi:MoaA/NifB/PqqE/SkfB family radical SAM enzyme
MEGVIERLANWSVGIPQPPVKLEIWPTTKCNLRCKFCGTWSSNQQDILSLNDFLKIINEATKLGVTECYISGSGEPFMRKNLILKIMKKVKERKMKGYIITNGTLMSKKDIEFMVKIGWDEIQFSVDAPSAKIHDYLRGKNGVFENVTKKIKYFFQLKKEKNLSKPTVLTNSVIVNKNYKKICEMIRCGNKLGVNTMIFQSLMNVTNFCKNLELTENNLEELRYIAKKATILTKELNICSNINNFTNSKYVTEANNVEKLFLKSVEGERGFLSTPCFDPWWHILVTGDGRVGSCGEWAPKSPESIFTSSLKEIWFGKYFDSFRERIRSKDLNGCWCCIPYVFHNNELRIKLKEKLNNIS